MIKLVRSDERLIHGQCMQFIVSDYSIKHILVVDDATANNALLKSIFTQAVPKSLKADVYTTVGAKDAIEQAVSNDVSTLLLMKNPRTLVKLMELVPSIPKMLNIGPQMARKGIKCADYATLYPEDIEACKTLVANGVHVYFNAIGGQGASIEWSSVVNKL